MRYWFVAGSAVLLLGGIACRTAAGADGGLAVADAGSDPLRLELLMPAHVRAGERLPIRLRVQNVSGRAIDLYLRGRAPTFDVLVARPSGEVVWRRLEGEIIPAIVHLHPLAPGERLEIETAWDQRAQNGRAAGAGDYVATGLLLVEGEPLRTPSASFTVR